MTKSRRPTTRPYGDAFTVCGALLGFAVGFAVGGQAGWFWAFGTLLLGMAMDVAVYQAERKGYISGQDQSRTTSRDERRELPQFLPGDRFYPDGNELTGPNKYRSNRD